MATDTVAEKDVAEETEALDETLTNETDVNETGANEPGEAEAGANETGEADEAGAGGEETSAKDPGAIKRSPIRKSPSGKSAAGPKQKSAGRGRRPILAVIAGVVLAALVAATGFFGYHYFADEDAAPVSDTERSEIMAVVNDYAVKMVSYDYRDLNKNRESVTAMSTKDFAAKYDEMVKALTEMVSSGQGEATGTVTHSAIESIDGDTATALVFANQKAKNVVAPQGRDQLYRMVITLQRQNGKWLVNDVQTV